MENEDTSRSTFFHCFTVFEVRFVESSIVFDPCTFPSSPVMGRSTGRFYFRLLKIKVMTPYMLKLLLLLQLHGRYAAADDADLGTSVPIFTRTTCSDHTHFLAWHCLGHRIGVIFFLRAFGWIVTLAHAGTLSPAVPRCLYNRTACTYLMQQAFSAPIYTHTCIQLCRQS